MRSGRDSRVCSNPGKRVSGPVTTMQQANTSVASEQEPATAANVRNGLDGYAESIQDAAFREKFVSLPGIISDWLLPKTDLSGGRVLDFGCGQGVTALGMALKLPQTRVHGVDICRDFDQLPELARREIQLTELPDNLSLETFTAGEKMPVSNVFDAVYSWSVFEHVNQELIAETLVELNKLLREGGLFFIQVAPLYYSAYGSHLRELLDVPWAHLLKQHSNLKHAVLGALKRVSDTAPVTDDWFSDYKRGVWGCYNTLNKLTAEQLIHAAQAAGFELIREYRTENDVSPPEELLRIFDKDVLTTEQIVLLLQKP